MDTETVLVANPKRKGSKLIEMVFNRIQGFITAQQNCMLSYNIKRSLLSQAMKITPGHDSPTITPLDDSDAVSVSALVRRDEVGEVMDQLKALGATSILQLDLANCRF